MTIRKHIIISEVSPLQQEDFHKLIEIDKTMQTIIDHITEFQFMENILNEKKQVIGYKEWNIKYPSEINRIEVDLSNQYDEFWIIDANEKPIAYIEVVTKLVAKCNDQEFLSDKELSNYEVGKVNSYYTRLADTNYYYREL